MITVQVSKHSAIELREALQEAIEEALANGEKVLVDLNDEAKEFSDSDLRHAFSALPALFEDYEAAIGTLEFLSDVRPELAKEVKEYIQEGVLPDTDDDQCSVCDGYPLSEGIDLLAELLMYIAATLGRTPDVGLGEGWVWNVRSQFVEAAVVVEAPTMRHYRLTIYACEKEVGKDAISDFAPFYSILGYALQRGMNAAFESGEPPAFCKGE